MKKQRLYQLLELKVQQTLTPEENAELSTMLANDEYENWVKEWIDQSFVKNLDHRMDAVTGKEMLGTILNIRTGQNIPAGNLPGPVVHRVHFLRRGWFRYAAAVILILLGLAIYLLPGSRHRGEPLAEGTETIFPDVAPGGQKALLTLSNGETIVLDSAANGNLAMQAGARIVKLANGEILYTRMDLASGEAVWNTMSTPVGGQYQVTLPDGTKVWLNAASSITYPTAFTGEKRMVKVKGEVYFEVTKNKHQPFSVEVYGGSTIEVLGTSFNVNSYENEHEVKTTLLEGEIRMVTGASSATLKPGQQASISYSNNNSAAEKIRILNDVDIEHTMAWKNGLFNFEGLDLKAVMRQLERWYDIEVVYASEESVDDEPFAGKVYRNVNLSEALEIVRKLADVKFRLEGRKLIVL